MAFLANPLNQMTSKSSFFKNQTAKSLNVVPKQSHQIVVYGGAIKPTERLTRRLTRLTIKPEYQIIYRNSGLLIQRVHAVTHNKTGTQTQSDNNTANQPRPTNQSRSA